MLHIRVNPDLKDSKAIRKMKRPQLHLPTQTLATPLSGYLYPKGVHNTTTKQTGVRRHSKILEVYKEINDITLKHQHIHIIHNLYQSPTYLYNIHNHYHS